MSLSRRALLGGAAAIALGAKSAHAQASAPAPVLYVSHGAPIFAKNDPARIQELSAWGARLPKPRGIVVMTPHFGTRALTLGATGRGVALYDLPGAIRRRVPPGLTYATPPSDAIAARIEALLGERARRADRGGFDHTTWMPLKCMFPAADVPVLELAYPYRSDGDLFALGRKLAPLRDDGIAFVASGGMTHNLASMDFGSDAHAAPPSWSSDFDAWASERVAARDADAIVDWRKKGPAQSLAHPDDGGHFRVLVVAMGVALGGASVARESSFPVTGYESTMSKRSVQWS